MKKQFFLAIILLITFSCKKKDEEIVEYDKNGKIISKTYINDKSRNTDSIIYYKSNMITKSFFYGKDKKSFYFKSFSYDGKLIAEGNTANMMKTGKWKFYDSENKIKRIVEFKNICGQEYPNQVWNYDKKGKLEIDNSSYFSYKIGGQITLNGVKGNDLKIFYAPGIKKGAICTINLSREINNNFCNVDSVEKLSLKSDDKFTFTIPIKSDDLKKKLILKGYIEEHHFDEKDANLNHTSRRVYIDVPIK